MDSPSHQSQALKLLHQTSPILIVVYWLLALVCDVGLRAPPKEEAGSRRLYRTTVTLTLAAAFTYVGEAILYIVHSLQVRGWWAQEHNVLFVMTSILVWGCLALILLESPFPRWLPYVGAWILGLVLEAVIFTLVATTRTERDAFSDARLAIMALRLVVLFILSVTGIVVASTVARAEQSTDEESQPLLGNGHVAQPDAAQYGAIPVKDDPNQADAKTGAEDEDEDEDKDVKEKQRKRLMEHGGWWGYVKGFFIFLPLIWPARNRKMQFYLFIIGLCVVFQRALNVLIPNQLGVITNKLALVSGTGMVPWREISLWIAFRFLSSRAGIDGVQSLLTTHLEQFSYLQITKAAFRHVMGLSMDFHTEKNSGELLKAVEQGYSLTQLLDYVVFDTIPLLVDLIVAFFFLSNLFDVYLAFTVIVVAITFFWTTIKLTAYNRESRRLYVDKYLKENKIMYESVSNWQTVAYFNRRKHEEERLDKAVKEHIDAYVRYNWSYNMIFAVQALVILFGLLVASFLAAYRIALNERTVGSFVTLVGYWSTLSSPLSRLANSYNRLASDLIDAERMLQLFNTKSNIEDKEDAQPLQITEGRVDFQNVGFAYDKRKATLKDMTFTAESGKTVALVGETGSGKSTTLKLLLRFYDVTAGSIKIDGQDIRDVQLHSLREAMGVVPQDPSMFNMSIMENIRYARLDATDEQVHEACRAAAVHDKILTFPDGYSTKVGERGVKLSGGELQRVAIARVLLKNPQLVLLDEATSAVDSATEIQIQEAFKRLSKGRTTFIIAHRLSTIMDADLILVIENGQIIERGTQQELLSMGGKYVDLWTKQTSRRTAGSTATTVGESSEDLLGIGTDDSARPSTASSSAPTASNDDDGHDTSTPLDQVDGNSDSKLLQHKHSRPKPKPRPNPDDDDEDASSTNGCFGLAAHFKGKTANSPNDGPIALQDNDLSPDVQQQQRIKTAQLKQVSPKPTYATDLPPAEVERGRKGGFLHWGQRDGARSEEAGVETGSADADADADASTEAFFTASDGSGSGRSMKTREEERSVGSATRAGGGEGGKDGGDDGGSSGSSGSSSKMDKDGGDAKK